MDGATRRAVGARVSCQLHVSAYALLCFVILPSLLYAPVTEAAAATTNDSGGKSDGASLLEIGRASKLAAPPPIAAPAAIKIVSYNIRWRGGDDLRALIRLLREDQELGRASVIGLQEVDRNRSRTNHINTARLMAEELGMYYAWAAPPLPTPIDKKRRKQKKKLLLEEEEEETGVAILSPYPLLDVERIVLPHEGPNNRRRAAIGATIVIAGRPIRVYSVHAETRLESAKKIAQLRAVLDALAAHTKIAASVVLGDFNTWKSNEVEGTDKLFRQAGFQTPFANSQPTWKDYLIFELKLDWIWLRGLQATANGIVRRVDLSDHWPLWLEAKFQSP